MNENIGKAVFTGIVSLIILVAVCMFINYKMTYNRDRGISELKENIAIMLKDTSEMEPILFNKISYEGHTYIVFDIGGNKAGVTHDENCRCRRK